MNANESPTAAPNPESFRGNILRGVMNADFGRRLECVTDFNLRTSGLIRVRFPFSRPFVPIRG